ncbi:DUF1330 domain-containing protein [Pseudomonas tolaasii]|uniref:DUF1330 domain-containing protein n=1 Tax=Pseudomonas TaxID=286 RepID=UPI0004703D21|nr:MULTISPECIES: DUF1330 domain-containing protein [Pseudomonas]MBW1248725.1 DUF1330 domain-containing protein [Pseudomonas tolaasii]
MQKKGFIYAELVVTDPDYFYNEYMTRVGPVLDKWGATFAIAGGEPEVLEGDRNVERVVLVEFESPEKAREFYHSQDYQDVIGYRIRSAKTDLYLLEGTAS